MSHHRRAPRSLSGHTLVPLLVAVSLPLGLACGGLPLPGTDGAPVGEDEELVAVEDGEADGSEEADGEQADTGDDGEQAGAGSIEEQFAALDPNEAPPHARSTIDCPKGAMRIRHPKGGRLTVYCATGSGVRTGPYTEWRGGRLVVAAMNVDGAFDGRWTRWERTDDGVRKVEERVYVAGVRQGDHAEWDVQGRLLVRGAMVDDERHGRFIERTLAGDELVTGGACYQGGEELWRTDDEDELASKPCDGDAVAEG